MVYYYKVNRKVAESANLAAVRFHTKDDCYILWQLDMKEFGSLLDIPGTMVRIGAIRLKPREAKQEQDGSVLRPLPVPTDPQFVIEDDSKGEGVESTGAEATGGETSQTEAAGSAETNGKEEDKA